MEDRRADQHPPPQGPSQRRLGGLAGGATALQLVLLIGLVSLFSDTTYEGARSVVGPFLGVLGATGFIVAVAAGSGEFVGYGLRLASGYLVDRTGRYWAIALAGYMVNLLAVPALALAGQWPVAVLLVILERVGKGMRTPARDVILSHAASRIGHGWAFGLHEAIDQIGALLGPLVVSLIVYLRGDYRQGFAFLLIPALLALSALGVARFLYPRPQALEAVGPRMEGRHLPRLFWLYLVGIALVAAGYADFPLVAFHLQGSGIAVEALIPLLYAVAMGVDGVAALLWGRLFDRIGVTSLALAALVAAPFPLLVFLGGSLPLAVGGMVLWGIGLAAQESVMRAAVARMVAAERRGSAFGIFNAGYGLAWFLGSALMGALYDLSLAALVAFAILIQVAAVPVFLLIGRTQRNT